MGSIVCFALFLGAVGVCLAEGWQLMWAIWAGIAVFAASGALIGVRKRLDLIGVWTLAALTGEGGGVARVVLLGIHPPASFLGWENLSTARIAAAYVFVFHPQFGRL